MTTRDPVHITDGAIYLAGQPLPGVIDHARTVIVPGVDNAPNRIAVEFLVGEVHVGTPPAPAEPDNPYVFGGGR